MMKMIFKLNEEKIKADGKSVEEMWAKVDAAFSKDKTLCERLADGSVEYTSKQEIEDDFNLFGISLAKLATDKIFLQYCSKWTWTEYEDDGVTVFEEEDVYEQAKNGKFGQPED